MSLQTINNGTFDNDASADKIRTAFDNVNSNFLELFTKIPLELSGEQGKVLIVKATEDGFELVALAGGGDLLSSNNLSDLLDEVQARANLGLGDLATKNSVDFATSTQGASADSAIQSISVGDGLSINVADPQNPMLTNTETNDYVSSVSFAPATKILTLTLIGGGTATVDLSAHTVLNIDGYTVKKGSGNTDYENIEVGDYCNGWDGDRYKAFKVDALPHTTESNRLYAVNNSI